MDFHFPQVFEAIAAAVPDREALVFRDRRLTYSQLRDRSRQLAQVLTRHGLGAERERGNLEGHESGQAHLALYLHNGNEYLESMLAAFKARLAPINLNYRFVEAELIEVLRDSNARALVYHASFASRVEKIRAELPQLRVLVQVEDASGAPLLPGARAYEDVLAAASPERPNLAWSPDDLYITYTGGTTGRPKGVLWRQADIFVANMNGRRADGSVFGALEQIVERARSSEIRVMPLAPFMHVTGHAAALGMWNTGGSVIVPPSVEAFDAASILDCMQRERANLTVIAGDAMARPLLTALGEQEYELDALKMLISGGAALSRRTKQELLERLPGVSIIEGVGSSETGGQATNVSSAAGGVASGGFAAGAGTTLLSADRTRYLDTAEDEVGWLARSGPIPLGYLNDADKTAETFPTLDGTRYVVPGDRARWRGAGDLEFLGRESTTINSGGEKIFAEEVESVLKLNPVVLDAAVTGRPSERFGQEVVAVVVLQPGANASAAALIEACAEKLARFKLPRAVFFRDEIQRGPAGKIDLPWLRQQVAEEAHG
jgi:acyl-CoA synthetase (AMP-forming)/AMP-acid ligase II